jgi:hypothetical protein
MDYRAQPRLDHRWGPLDQQRLRQRAEELVALAPDAMIVAGGGAGEAVQRVSRTVPIVLAGALGFRRATP